MGDYRAVYGDGLLTLHDPDTGAEVGRMATDTEDWAGTADVVVATTGASAPGGLKVTAYRLPEFTPLWEKTAPVLADFHGCGEWLCLSANGAVTTFDPATGEQEWRADWLPDGDLYDVDSTTPYEDYWRISADSRVDADHGRDGWLVARDTGQPVLHLDGWGQGAWYSVPDAGVLTWGFDEHQRQWLGRVRPDLSAVDPLGTVGDPASCDLDTDAYPYLACRTGEDYPWTVQVWRVAG